DNIFPILKTIIDFNHFTWQFPFFTYGNKTNTQCIRYRTSDNKSSRFRTDYDISIFFFSIRTDFINCRLECFTVIHKRCNFFKLCTLCWPVLNDFDIVFIIHEWVPPSVNLQVATACLTTASIHHTWNNTMFFRWLLDSLDVDTSLMMIILVSLAMDLSLKH